jgi:hypothetical protein
VVPALSPDLPCLVSVEAFLAAPPDELAAAVMARGLAHTVDLRPIERRVEVTPIVAEVARVIGLADLKPGLGLHQALQQPPLSEVADAVTEGIIFGEQRLCMARSVNPEGIDQVRLLRRGRVSITSGDLFAYLR